MEPIWFQSGSKTEPFWIQNGGLMPKKAPMFYKNPGAAGGYMTVGLDGTEQEAVQGQVTPLEDYGKQDVYKDRDLQPASAPGLKGKQ